MDEYFENFDAIVVGRFKTMGRVAATRPEASALVDSQLESFNDVDQFIGVGGTRVIVWSIEAAAAGALFESLKLAVRMRLASSETSTFPLSMDAAEAFARWSAELNRDVSPHALSEEWDLSLHSINRNKAEKSWLVVLDDPRTRFRYTVEVSDTDGAIPLMAIVGRKRLTEEPSFNPLTKRMRRWFGRR